MYMKLPLTLLALAGHTSAYGGSGGGGEWIPKYGSSIGGGGGGGGQPPRLACLNATGVQILVEGYTYLLEHPGGADFNSTAEAILSDTSFVVESDSILTLSGRAVRTPHNNKVTNKAYKKHWRR